MDSEEKYFLILNKINEKINISAKNTSIFLDFTDVISKEFTQDDAESIMSKLKIDEKAINDFEFLENFMRSNSFNYWCMVDLDYDKFMEYFKSYNRKKSRHEECDSDFLSNKNIYCKLAYDELSREIFINNFLLSTPHYESPNRHFFEHIYKNPNKEVSRKEILDENGECIKKNIHAILNELGFRDDLKKAFFPVATKSYVHFRNPIFNKDLEDLHIKYLKFPTKKTTAKKDS